MQLIILALLSILSSTTSNLSNHKHSLSNYKHSLSSYKHSFYNHLSFDLQLNYQDDQSKTQTCQKTDCSIALQENDIKLDTCLCQLQCGDQFIDKSIMSKQEMRPDFNGQLVLPPIVKQQGEKFDDSGFLYLKFQVPQPKQQSIQTQDQYQYTIDQTSIKDDGLKRCQKEVQTTYLEKAHRRMRKRKRQKTLNSFRSLLVRTYD